MTNAPDRFVQKRLLRIRSFNSIIKRIKVDLPPGEGRGQVRLIRTPVFKLRPPSPSIFDSGSNASANDSATNSGQSADQIKKNAHGVVKGPGIWPPVQIKTAVVEDYLDNDLNANINLRAPYNDTSESSSDQEDPSSTPSCLGYYYDASSCCYREITNGDAISGSKGDSVVHGRHEDDGSNMEKTTNLHGSQTHSNSRVRSRQRRRTNTSSKELYQGELERPSRSQRRDEDDFIYVNASNGGSSSESDASLGEFFDTYEVTRQYPVNADPSPHCLRFAIREQELPDTSVLDTITEVFKSKTEHIRVALDNIEVRPYGDRSVPVDHPGTRHCDVTSQSVATEDAHYILKHGESSQSLEVVCNSTRDFIQHALRSLEEVVGYARHLSDLLKHQISHNRHQTHSFSSLWQDRQKIMGYIRGREMEAGELHKSLYNEIGKLRHTLTQKLLRDKESTSHIWQGDLSHNSTMDVAYVTNSLQLDKINQLKLLVFSQQQYIIALERDLRESQESSGAKTSHRCAPTETVQSNGKELPMSSMCEVLSCDCISLCPGEVVPPDINAARVFNSAPPDMESLSKIKEKTFNINNLAYSPISRVDERLASYSGSKCSQGNDPALSIGGSFDMTSVTAVKFALCSEEMIDSSS